jgi:hypothetical protein
VVKNHKEIDPSFWTEAHAKLIKRAASYPEVERIFVHPPIKKALCDWELAQPGSHAWLAKVRPYYNHTFHFHPHQVPYRFPRLSRSGDARTIGWNRLRSGACLLVFGQAVGTEPQPARAEASYAQCHDVGSSGRMSCRAVNRLRIHQSSLSIKAEAATDAAGSLANSIARRLSVLPQVEMKMSLMGLV